MALLHIHDLTVRYGADPGPVVAVEGVDFEVGAGECVGVVGESGSGKTQLVLAALRLVSPAARVTGRAEFDGIDLLQATPQQLNSVRGRAIGFVFQDPMTSLTPHLTVGAQLCEVLRVHRGLERRAAHRRGGGVLERVHLGDPAERLPQYPHQLSGGMRQRVMIALALACEPQLLIADEPTTALDVTVQAGILELLRELKSERRLAIVLITHDFGVAASLCDRVVVMYAGRIVEEAPVAELFGAPRHPYSAGLLASLPRLDAPTDVVLASIEGQPPAPHETRLACAFAPRCARADERCRDEEPCLVRESGSARAFACHHPLGEST
jgi:oligopeptide/dipeptide ABC transporter ATP-binding protein